MTVPVYAADGVFHLAEGRQASALHGNGVYVTVPRDDC